MSNDEITKIGSNFDVYISYNKSEGKQIARLLNFSFKNAGYRCFFNPNNSVEEKLNIKLQIPLFDAPIFVMVLTKDYFANCNEESDLIRQEIEIALTNQKIIIPINYNDSLNAIPDYLDEYLKNQISAFDIVNLNSGNKFALSFYEMLSKRLVNYKKLLENHNDKAVVSVISDQDSFLFKNNKVIATLQADEESYILLSEGNHLLKAQSIENPNISSRIIKNIPRVPWEDFIEINFLNDSYVNKSINLQQEIDILEEVDAEEKYKKHLELTQTLIGHNAAIVSVNWSNDGQFIATASIDKTIKIWEANSGKCIQTLVGHSLGVSSAVWSLDGKRIVSGSRDKSIKVWEVESGKCLQTFTGHTGVVVSALWNIEENNVLSISWDKTLKIWDVNSGACIHTLEGHKSCVESAAYSPIGNLIVSASDEGILRIWDANEGKCLQVLTGHTWRLHSATWSPNGDKIIFALDDYTVKYGT